MEILITEQGLQFLFSLIVGFGLGVFYDVFRIFRIAIPSGWIAVFLQDMIFCIVSAFSVIIFIFYTNSGQVRWFCLFGAMTAFIVYHMTVGKFMIFISKKIINFIKKLLLFMYNITLKPVFIVLFYIFKKLYEFITLLKNAFYRLCENIGYQAKKKKLFKKAGRGYNLSAGMPKFRTEKIKNKKSSEKTDGLINVKIKNPKRNAKKKSIS